MYSIHGNQVIMKLLLNDFTDSIQISKSLQPAMVLTFDNSNLDYPNWI